MVKVYCLTLSEKKGPKAVTGLGLAPFQKVHVCDLFRLIMGAYQYLKSYILVSKMQYICQHIKINQNMFKKNTYTI